MLHSEGEESSIELFDIETELINMSETSPVIAFLNCNRMTMPDEPPVKPKPIRLSESHRLAIVYAAMSG